MGPGDDSVNHLPNKCEGRSLISITHIKSQAQLGTFGIPEVARWEVETGDP